MGNVWTLFASLCSIQAVLAQLEELETLPISPEGLQAFFHL